LIIRLQTTSGSLLSSLLFIINSHLLTFNHPNSLINQPTCLAKEEKLLLPVTPQRVNSPDHPRLVSSSLSVVSTECCERETTLSVSEPVHQVSRTSRNIA
jgi:hypothetical protein